jgi:hypothetical protein
MIQKLYFVASFYKWLTYLPRNLFLFVFKSSSFLCYLGIFHRKTIFRFNFSVQLWLCIKKYNSLVKMTDSANIYCL